MILDNLQSLHYFLPELTLIIGLVLVVLCDISLKRYRNALNPLLTLVTIGLAFVLALKFYPATGATLFQGMLALDSFSQFFKLFLLLASGLVLLASLDSAELAPTHQGEFFALLLSVTLGMLLLSSFD